MPAAAAERGGGGAELFTYSHTGISMCKICASPGAPPLPLQRPKSALSH